MRIGVFISPVIAEMVLAVDRLTFARLFGLMKQTQQK
jgi:hypothetical protein